MKIQKINNPIAKTKQPLRQKKKNKQQPLGKKTKKKQIK
jgi:hypothetical protein